MAKQRFYMAVERLNLSDNNWNILITAMQEKGENQDPNACNRNHWRVSLDETMQVFEAKFETTVVDVDWFLNWMSNLFGIPVGDIGDTTGYNSYGRFSTFSYPDGVTNRIRIGIFGFVSGQGWPSYEDSHIAMLQYLSDNLAEWETPEV